MSGEAEEMRYLCTRGGPAVTDREAILRGLSRQGGLYVPGSPPEALTIPQLKGLSFQQIMARFYHRFLPSLTEAAWEAIVVQAFSELSGESQVPRLPLTRLNDYLDRYFLINADGMPTGSMNDLSLAILEAVLARFGDSGKRPLILGLLTQDAAASLAVRQASGLPRVLITPLAGRRGRELAGLASDLLFFEDSYNARYKEFSELAAREEFARQLNVRGYEALYLGPGHLLEVLTGGALATAVMARIAETAGEEKTVDFAVPRGHLGFLSGLVYASTLQLPVGTVYVGDKEPSALAALFARSKAVKKERDRRKGEGDASFPVNLERLFFEVSGREVERTGLLTAMREGNGESGLTEEEKNLLSQSIVVDGCHYKYCLRLIRTVYDQTDYLVGADTAEAMACWARHSDKKADTAVCFVQKRSPLLDADICSQALFGRDSEPGQAAVRLSREAGIPIWSSLEAVGEGDPGDRALLDGPIGAAILDRLPSR